MKPIHVTKTFLPPIEEYKEYLDKIWKTGHLTNQGPILKDFEKKISKKLNINKFHFVANGTLALQLAIRALDITGGDIITTPFSYVATTSAILWEHCNPIYVDIEEGSLCIDPLKIEAAITPNTKAIIAVHVFGRPCDIEQINKIAKKNNLKVIYDASHAFGAEFKNKSLLDYGDISTCSFHATKLFHTIEGGCLITNNEKLSDKIELLKRFGHEGDEHKILGINAKASEFQAAMGLSNLKYIDELINKRKQITEIYNKLLNNSIKNTYTNTLFKYNYSYYPIILKSENQAIRLLDKLKLENIFPRRYFYPSLNTLPYLSYKQHCPISEDISSRILCLPLFPGLRKVDIEKICKIVNRHSE